MRDMAPRREQLIRCAETVLRPSVAILLECAYEGERCEAAAAFLESEIKRFYSCAVNGEPLRDGDYELFGLMTPIAGGEELLTVGLLSGDTQRRESTEQISLTPKDSSFAGYVAERVIASDLTPLAPAIIGVGVADSDQEAALLARMAYFRSPDIHSVNKKTALCERRTLAAINRKGPGAGGLGGGHSALAVSIEQTGEGYVALCPGDYFTRCAVLKL